MRAVFFLCVWLVVSLGVSSVGRAQSINLSDYGTVTLHLKADALALADGASVTTWGPLTSTTGVAGTTAPTFKLSDTRFNNKPTVTFLNANKSLLIQNSANIVAQTIFIVASQEGSVSLAGVISRGDDKLNVRRDSANLFYRSTGHGLDANEFMGVVAGGSLALNQVANGGFTLNTAHLVYTTAGAPQTYSNFWLGGASPTLLARCLTGSVAEVIIYSGTLTQTGIDRVGYYLQTKYALPTNFPPPFATVNSFTGTTASGIVSEGGILSTPGAPVTLGWTTTNTTSVSIDQGVLAAPGTTSGTAVVSPAVTTTYTLTASNLTPSSTTKTVTVYIGVTPQPPVINEILADNANGILDDELTLQDWIEIYNPNAYAIDLQGYRLKNNLNEWDFPAGSGIPANGYRVVFASSKNRTNPATQLHTNFNLSSSGENLTLVRIADLAVVSGFTPYPKQFPDASYGAWPNPGPFAYFGKPTGAPTPGAANGAVGVLGLLDQTDDTSFSVDRGSYTAAVSTTLSATTPGATIVYTLDGSEPTLTNGTQIPPLDSLTAPSAVLTIHPGAVPGGATGINIASIGGVTTIRAAVFKTNYAPTNIDTQTYIFPTQVLGQTVTDATSKGWPAASVNGQLFNYGMDPNAVAAYGETSMLESLKSLQTVSIVTDIKNLVDPAIGIYTNADQHGEVWERPASIELIRPPGYVDPDGNTKGFQINAGLRIRGGASRGDAFFKHALRMYFNSDYDGKLNYRLFGNEGANKFSVVDLATSSNYGWYREAAYGTGKTNTMCRDMFCRDTQGALGQPYPKSRFYHLYVNGHYWGVYYTDERPVADFAASYFGGVDTDYDAVKCGNRSVTPNFATEATDGDLVAWTNLWNKCRAIATNNPGDDKFWEIQGCNPDGTRNPALPILLDVDNLIDEMLVLFYAGDGDAVLSNFLAHNTPNNWFSVSRRDGAMGLKCFIHDAEHTLGANSSVVDQTGPWGGSNVASLQFSNPQRMHQDLMSSPAYRRRFADHVQKHFFNNGALTPSKCIARFLNRANQVKLAMKAEEARWGDAQTISGLPVGHAARYTVADWQAEVDRVTNTIMPNRSQIVLDQLIADGLYPKVSAPVIADNATGLPQHGGNVLPGFQARLTASSGTIYYTLDGTDPRPAAQVTAPSTTFVAAGSNASWHVPTSATDGFTAYTLTAVPKGYYPLDFAAAPAAGGSVPDSATADGIQNGVFVGSPTQAANRLGTANTAIAFSGTGQAITIADAAPLQITGQITLAAWVRTTSNSGVRNIISRGNTNTASGNVFLRMNNGDFEVGSYNGTNHLAATSIYTDINAWVHLCGVYDGTAWKLYRNGALVSTTVDAVGAVSVATNPGWGIGSSANGTGNLFIGSLDEIYIFQGALSDADIQALAGNYRADFAAVNYTPVGTWTTSPMGIGYERDITNTLDPRISTDIEASLYNVRSTCVFRQTFTSTAGEISGIQNLLLKLRYDDGFVAYLNGVEVARKNAPLLGSVNGTSVASAAHPDADAMSFETFDISSRAGLLVDGTNVLAIHGLNLAVADEDFLIDAELSATGTPNGASPTALVYSAPFTISSATPVNARSFNAGQWSALVSANFTINTVAANASNLVVSQIDYNPPSGNTAEFVELLNISEQNVDLTGVHLRDAVDYDFPAGTLLAPGARLQVVGALAAFTDPGLRPFGPMLGNLSNGGEHLVVVSDSTGIIKDFTYDDESPWPKEADGFGYRLVLIRPSSNPDHNNGLNWRGNATPGNYTGTSDATLFTGDPNADVDGDGLSAFTEYAMGTSDSVATPPSSIVNGTVIPVDPGTGAEDFLSITFTHPVNRDDALYIPEISSDLSIWNGAPTALTLVTTFRDEQGNVVETWRSTSPVSSQSKQFVRLRTPAR